MEGLFVSWALGIGHGEDLREGDYESEFGMGSEFEMILWCWWSNIFG